MYLHCWLCKIQGFEYLMKYELVDDTAEELSKFLHSNRQLDPQKKREFLATRLAYRFCCMSNLNTLFLQVLNNCCMHLGFVRVLIGDVMVRTSKYVPYVMMNMLGLLQ